jgi:hypothetical protein
MTGLKGSSLMIQKMVIKSEYVYKQVKNVLALLHSYMKSIQSVKTTWNATFVHLKNILRNKLINF